MAEKQMELVPHKEAPAPADVRQPENLMGALIQAAMNPEIDADKMERMLAMYERMEATKDRRDFHDALAAMLPELPEVKKAGSAVSGSQHLYTYAKWEDINRAIKPILQKHGFALTFRTEDHDKGVLVTGVLSRGGHQEETRLLVPADKAGAMSSAQARGNAVSYGKRYTAASLLNLVTADEPDNDGRPLSGDNFTEQQAAHVRKLLKDLGREEGTFLQYAQTKGHQAEKIEDLPFEAYDDLVKALNGWLAKQQKGGANG